MSSWDRPKLFISSSTQSTQVFSGRSLSPVSPPSHTHIDNSITVTVFNMSSKMCESQLYSIVKIKQQKKKLKNKKDIK